MHCSGQVMWKITGFLSADVAAGVRIWAWAWAWYGGGGRSLSPMVALDKVRCSLTGGCLRFGEVGEWIACWFGCLRWFLFEFQVQVGLGNSGATSLWSLRIFLDLGTMGNQRLYKLEWG